MLRELDDLSGALRHYITASYHLSDPVLAARREALLREPGTLSQQPFVESSARYKAERRYHELALPAPVRDLLAGLGRERVVFDPPYNHQGEALEAILHPDERQRHDVIVTTGTGSGKTECFLLPILGRLADEASSRPTHFCEHRAIRALVLYPMNALVNDQLGRLRTLFGHASVRAWFTRRGGRPAKFARYTGKTLYPGPRKDEDPRVPRQKQSQRFRQALGDLSFYLDLEERAAAETALPPSERTASQLIEMLRAQGKWPVKAGGVTSWYGKGAWGSRVRERPADAELFLRHEVQDNPSDVLVTNYSMLEYMLLRPIEDGIFTRTREYLQQTGESFVLVLDEAHLYRGVTGVEVGMLVRRLCRRLGIGTDQLQVIATSASFNTDAAARSFVAGLSGKSADDLKVLAGSLRPCPRGTVETSPEVVEALAALGGCRLDTMEPSAAVEALRAVVQAHGDFLGPMRSRALVLRRQPGALAGSVAGLVRGVDASLEPVQVAFELAAGDEELELATPLAAALEVQVLQGEAGVALAFSDSASAVHFTLSAGQATPSPDRSLICRLLHDLLSPLVAATELVNLTSGSDLEQTSTIERLGPAKPVGRLQDLLFRGLERGGAATETLLELCPTARGPDDTPLLAARVHCFFRGLPGLWACINRQCSEVSGQRTSLGRLFAQPRHRCGCGSSVYELYSCRDCGRPFLQAYAEDARSPDVFFSSPGSAYGGRNLEPVSLAVDDLLQRPDRELAKAGTLDLVTGQLTQRGGGCPVWLPARFWRPTLGFRNNQARVGKEQPGRFAECPHCGAGKNRSRYPIQDHVTSGDDPFLEVVRRQVLSQPPRGAAQTPLRGRKALMFSDSRQMAERIAARLERSALQDALRPLLLLGAEALEDRLGVPVALDRAYLSVLVGCALRGVSPRPDGDWEFSKDLARVQADLFEGRTLREGLRQAWVDEADRSFSNDGHEVLADVLTRVLHDRHTGLMAIGLASPVPVLVAGSRESLARRALPAPRGLSADGSVDWSLVSEDRAKELLITLWVQLMVAHSSLRLPFAPEDWVNNPRSGPQIRKNSGAFANVLGQLLPRDFNRRSFKGATSTWRRHLSERFLERDHLLAPSAVALRVGGEPSGPGWGRCPRCSRVQPLLYEVDLVAGGRDGTCRSCGHCSLAPLEGQARALFEARKGLFGQEHLRSRQDPTYAPHPLHTAAHTAGIGASKSDAATGRPEEYELRFQDVPLQREVNGVFIEEPPIDVLSVTTTMEVGIDIGSLTAVALRNVPPGRANYQQRAGRAGRRGSSLSMVLTWCGADSHDRNYFRNPRRMISGAVPDPKLQMDNPDVLRRHLYAELLASFRREVRARTPTEHATSNVLDALGTVDEFARSDPDGFTFEGLRRWVVEQRERLEAQLRSILPAEVAAPDLLVGEALSCDLSAKGQLLHDLQENGAGTAVGREQGPSTSLNEEAVRLEERIKTEPDEIIRAVFERALREKRALLAAERARLGGLKGEDELDRLTGSGLVVEEKLLDHLFARGLLPSYAFPTQVATFHVFDRGGSAYGRAALRHQPQRDLSQALSSFAPGREVWVDKAAHRSFAVYSPFRGSRERGVPGDFEVMKAKEERYLECRQCGHVDLLAPGQIEPGQEQDCPACGTPGGQLPAMRWLRPPGMAHPVFMKADRVGGEMVASRATSARLSAPVSGSELAIVAGGRIRVWGGDRPPLIWTNTGRAGELGRDGFRLCLSCGMAEPGGLEDGPWSEHKVPYPARRTHCQHSHHWTKVALGTKQVTDVAILRLRVDPDEHGVQLRVADDCSPLASASRTALTTLTQALVAAVVDLHDLEPGDLAGHYRVARTPAGQLGREVELYLYDAVSDGAGHSRRAAEEIETVLHRALAILSDSDHNQHCQSACYDCLCSYRNRFQHGDLDRTLGRDLLEYCLFGTVPVVSDQRQLLQNLERAVAGAGQHAQLEGPALRVNGLLVALHHPLCPPRSNGGNAGPGLSIDAWLVKRNLPAAVSSALRTRGRRLRLPPALADVPEAGPGTVPMFDWSDVVSAGSLTAARPAGHLRRPTVRQGAKVSAVLRIPDLVLTERLEGGSHFLLLSEPEGWATPAHIMSAENLSDLASSRYFLVARTGAAGAVFGGVRGPLAVAKVRRNRRGSRLIVSFAASLPGAESTFFRADDLIILARVVGRASPKTGAISWQEDIGG